MVLSLMLSSVLLHVKDQYPWCSKYAGVFVMQISSQMANAQMLWT